MSNQPIRVALIGLGNRAAWAAHELSTSANFDLVALVDPVAARVELFRREFAIAHVRAFADLDACLSAVDLDALAVLTPDGTHADVVVPALDAGLHVFVEKPLDVTEERIARIIDADQRAGGKTFVGFNLRFAPVYQKVRQLLDAGEAGQVLTIQADEFYDGGRTYFRRWNRLQGAGGGLWITKASHDFDLLYWMAGSKPQQVYATSHLAHYRPRAEAAEYCRDCRLRDDCHDRYDRYMPAASFPHRLNVATEQATGLKPDLCLYNSDKDTFDHGMAQVVFENGVMATYTVNVVAGFTNRRMRVSGTRATIDADLADGQVIVRRRDPSSTEVICAASDDGGHGGADGFIFPSFARFIRRLPVPILIPPQEAAVSVRMGLAAQRSCEEGGPVIPSPSCMTTAAVD